MEALDFTGRPCESVTWQGRLKLAVMPPSASKQSTEYTGLYRAARWTLPGFPAQEITQYQEVQILIHWTLPVKLIEPTNTS